MKAETEAKIREIVQAVADRRERWWQASMEANAAFRQWNENREQQLAAQLHDVYYRAEKYATAMGKAYESDACASMIEIERLLRVDVLS